MTTFFLLVADDQVDFCKLLKYSAKMVYKNAVQVVCVATVPKLYGCLAIGQPLPDLLLLDYHLRPLPCKAPDVLRWIRQQDQLLNLKVNVWSSLPYGPEAEMCLLLGAHRFITKSDAMCDMVEFIKQLVEGAEPVNQGV